MNQKGLYKRLPREAYLVKCEAQAEKNSRSRLCVWDTLHERRATESWTANRQGLSSQRQTITAEVLMNYEN